MFGGLDKKMEEIKRNRLKRCIGSLSTAFIMPLLLLVVSGAIQSKYSILVVFACFAPLFSVNALQEYMQYRQLGHNIQLREIGKYVYAEIDLIMQEHPHGTFSVRCRRIETIEGERDYFTSEVYDTREYYFPIKAGDVIPVYLNPDDPDDYFVDIVGK